MALSQKTIDTVKATIPVLEEHGETLTTHFYKRLFELYPEVKEMFDDENQRSGKQPTALAASVLAYARYIDNLEALSGAVSRIADRHTQSNVQPEHYPIVGEVLLLSMKEVLKEGATDEVLSAWGEAYGALADIMIGLEQDIYQSA